MGVWFTSAVTGFMMVNTLGILLPSISADLGLSPSQQGMLGSAAFWGNLVLAVPLSWWASRFRPKILTAVTLILGTLFILSFTGLSLSAAGILLRIDDTGVIAESRESVEPV